MVKHFTLASLLLLAATPLLSQGLVVLTNENGEEVNGTVIQAYLTGLEVDTVKLYATLSGDSARTVNVRRHELEPVEGTRNFFCWGVCYLPANSGQYPTWVSNHPVEMEPAQAYNNFGAYYQYEGQEGITRFRFVWYDQDDPLAADSSWVDVEFGGMVGISDRTTSAAVLESWPNPAAGNDITIAHSIAGLMPGTELVIYNILGERISAQPLRTQEGFTVIHGGTLTTGVYFANIERAGSALATQRIVVTR